MTAEPTPILRRDLLGPLAVAAVALVSVVLTLDAAGDYPKLFEGPGITLDESFNVQMGVYQWRALRDGGNFVLLLPDSVDDLFGPKSNYNPDHPPLGRVWLGFWHDLVEWLFPPSDHPLNEHGIRFVTDCARVGSAAAFALTVFLIGLFATKWYGRAAGIVAAVSLVLMPRVFAHAHLASLETFMNLTYSAAILAVAHWWRVESDVERVNVAASLREANPSREARQLHWVIPATSGVLFGLALLTKMQAILIPPAVGVWALWHWRVRAIKPLVIFGFVGLIVFFVGWPWLWLDPLHNVREYFARTTSRAVLNCYYLGQVWADKDVPWHYPFVMFAVTVPMGLHLLGLCGVIGGRAWRQPREQLLLAATLFPLVLFALPSIAVYDGERLFLISYPMWAILIGRGAQFVWNFWCQKAETSKCETIVSKRQRTVRLSLWLLAIFCLFGLFVMVQASVLHPKQVILRCYLIGTMLFCVSTYPVWGFWIRKMEVSTREFLATDQNRSVVLFMWLLMQSVGVITTHPCQLSYFNSLVSGSPGAERLGFERTYWGDSLTRRELEVVAKGMGVGGILVVEPVLHQFQLKDLLEQSPILRQKKLRLVTPAEAEQIADPKTVRRIVFCRRAEVSRERCDFNVGDVKGKNINVVHSHGVILTNSWEESPYSKTKP